MNKRPVVAGVLIGLLAFKPQFGLLIPLALLAGRQWTAFAAATVTTVVLVAGTAALFGPETWLAFWNNLAVINQKMAEGHVPILKMTSLFATLRVHGVDASIAYALHGVLAAAVAAVVAWVWHRRRATAGSAAVLIVGALLVSAACLRLRPAGARRRHRLDRFGRRIRANPCRASARCWCSPG